MLRGRIIALDLQVEPSILPLALVHAPILMEELAQSLGLGFPTHLEALLVVVVEVVRHDLFVFYPFSLSSFCSSLYLP